MIIAVGILKYGNFRDQFVRPAVLLHLSNSWIAIPRAGGRFSGTIQAMGFNRRKMEDERRRLAEKQAAERRATDPQIIEDAERLVATWNERQEKRMPMLFSPTIGAAISARYWYLWVCCPACRTINAIDLRTLDRHRDAAVTSLIPALSCRSCRPNAPFAELVRLSQTSTADEMRKEHRLRALGE